MVQDFTSNPYEIENLAFETDVKYRNIHITPLK